jgi:electron-transferring-flavoprotein dehydrogenase
MVEALAADDVSAAKLDYREAFDASWAGEEMYATRNFRQGYHKGLIPGMMKTGMWIGSFGKLPGGRASMPEDYQTLDGASKGKTPESVSTDEELYLDILTDVYKSGSLHREEQPSHCKILDESKCAECYAKYQAPCTRFCPAKVYELEMTGDDQFDRIQVNFSNCVHCKTCEIKDPLQNIQWCPPEGGDGPKYQQM